MDPDNRVLRRHGISAHKPSLLGRILRLGVPAMFRPKPFKQRLDRLGETGIRSRLRRPDRVTARGGHGEEREDRDAGGLPLVRNIRVEACRGEGTLSYTVLIIRTEVDVVDFEAVLDVRADRLYNSVLVHPHLTCQQWSMGGGGKEWWRTWMCKGPK